MFPMGIQTATNVYVGNFIGANNVRKAKYFSRIS